MNDHQFNILQELEQTTAIWQKGVYLTERVEGFHKFILYQLEDFYVEVTWHTHFNVILKVASFTDVKQLDAYLSSIDINDKFDFS
jgi:hypothetical protein